MGSTVNLNLLNNYLTCSPVNRMWEVGLLWTRMRILNKDGDCIVYVDADVTFLWWTQVTPIVVVHAPFVHAPLNYFQDYMTRQILKYQVRFG